MRRLAIIPNDPIDLYLSTGYTERWLKDYFNPSGFFDEVYSLAPYERAEEFRAGVSILPTPVDQLSRRLRELEIDVIRAYGGAHPCRVACAAKTSGIPVVVSVHDARPSELDLSVEDADVVLCVSATVKRLVSTRFTREEFLWELPNRIEFREMRSYSHADLADLSSRYPFKYKIVQVGRKSPEKNIETLIRSLRVLGPDYCLLAIGPGPTAEYERMAVEAGVSSRCFLLGAVPNDQLARYYSWADCSCTPSLTEAFPNVVIEALACGAAVVTSAIPAHVELIVDGENGLLVADYQNPVALADALRTACTDGDARRAIRQHARSSVGRFERSKVDALEASYYAKVLELESAGAFRSPVGTLVKRRLIQAARTFPQPIKDTLKPLKPLIGR
jgi:glycosyltransferase involved in cell wall biosynthesis